MKEIFFQKGWKKKEEKRWRKCYFQSTVGKNKGPPLPMYVEWREQLVSMAQKGVLQAPPSSGRT